MTAIIRIYTQRLLTTIQAADQGTE